MPFPDRPTMEWWALSRARRGVAAVVAATLLAWCCGSIDAGATSIAHVSGDVATLSITKPPQRGVSPGRWGKVRLRLTNVGGQEVTRVRVTGRGTDVFAGTVTLTEPLSAGESAVVRLPVLLTVMAPRRFVVEALASPGPASPTRRQIVIRPR